jgi:hypothetical protein
MADEVERQAPKRKPATTKKRPAQRSKASRAVHWGGVVTSFIKLGGLAIAANEALFQPPPHDALVFGVAAFMMAGAQGIDTVLSVFLGGSRPPTDDDSA